MAVSTLKAVQTTGTASRQTGTSGTLSWVRQGKVVTVTGMLNLASATTHGTTLFSGLPTPATDYAPVPVHNSSTGYHFSSFLRENGDLNNSEQWAAGVYRISGSYLTT